jgi:pyruvate,water dikinase
LPRVGCEDATLRIASGQYITVDCTAPRGVVYNGTIEFEVQSLELDTIPKPETKICLLLANPDAAFQQSFLPNDGVGLARMEFIVSSWIKVHPLALLHPEKLTPDVRVAVSKIIGNGSGSNVSFTAQVGSDYFVENLSEGLGMIAAAFYPKPVILRFSDFKTDEYANLLGGRQFEPIEDNPVCVVVMVLCYFLIQLIDDWLEGMQSIL